MRTNKSLKRGKVLKVKLGYNANSSSLSAMVTIVMLGSAAAVAVVGMITTLLLARKPAAAPTRKTDVP